MDDIIEKTDEKLMKFYHQTGIWPPGKSMSAAMCGGEDKEMIRARAYERWCKDREALNIMNQKWSDQVYRVASLRAENDELRTALNEAIRRPMGVVPDSAVKFVELK